MKEKFILEIYNENDELQSTTKCKSYVAIGTLTNIDYHNCRKIHLICIGKNKPKFLHPVLKELIKRVKILDNPEHTTHTF